MIHKNCFAIDWFEKLIVIKARLNLTNIGLFGENDKNIIKNFSINDNLQLIKNNYFAQNQLNNFYSLTNLHKKTKNRL